MTQVEFGVVWFCRRRDHCGPGPSWCPLVVDVVVVAAVSLLLLLLLVIVVAVLLRFCYVFSTERWASRRIFSKLEFRLGFRRRRANRCGGVSALVVCLLLKPHGGDRRAESSFRRMGGGCRFDVLGEGRSGGAVDEVRSPTRQGGGGGRSGEPGLAVGVSGDREVLAGVDRKSSIEQIHLYDAVNLAVCASPSSPGVAGTAALICTFCLGCGPSAPERGVRAGHRANILPGVPHGSQSQSLDFDVRAESRHKQLQALAFGDVVASASRVRGERGGGRGQRQLHVSSADMHHAMFDGNANTLRFWCRPRRSA